MAGMTFLKTRPCSLWNSIKNFRRVSNFELKYSNAKTEEHEIKEKVDDLFSLVGPKKKKLFSRPLSEDFLQNLKSVTTIAVALNYVSWCKISLPSFHLVDWDCEKLPDKESEDIMDTDLLATAITIKDKLPVSDLYIMEGQTNKQTTFRSGMTIRYMLITLLATSSNGTLENSKLLLQKPLILNCLMKLTVGGERISSKEIIHEAFIKDPCMNKSDDQPTNDNQDPFMLLKLRREVLYSFCTYPESKQESLAVALLLNLGFLYIAYLKHPKAIAEIEEKISKKTKLRKKSK